jgi:hypothetical protein
MVLHEQAWNRGGGLLFLWNFCRVPEGRMSRSMKCNWMNLEKNDNSTGSPRKFYELIHSGTVTSTANATLVINKCCWSRELGAGREMSWWGQAPALDMAYCATEGNKLQKN